MQPLNQLIQPNLTGPLVAVLSARSTTEGSLSGQHEYLEAVLRDAYDWPLECERIGEVDAATWLFHHQIQQAVQTNGADVVLIEDLTRLGRDLHEVGEFVASCARQGVQVISVADGTDLTSVEGV